MFKKWRASAETEMSLRAAQARMTANLVGNGNTNILHARLSGKSYALISQPI
jgi:hypothetical protein